MAESIEDPGPNANATHLASVLAIVAEAIISVAADHRIIFFNQGAERIFGYDASEVLGRPLNLLLPERFRGVHDAHVEGFARSSITARQMGERLEVRALRRNGEEFPAEASIAKQDGPEGLVLTVVLRDVTEQRRTQAELENRERQLSEAQKIARLGSWEWEPDRDVATWSTELYRIYGLDPDAPLDFEGLMAFVHPADRSMVQERVQRAIETGEPFEFRHRIVREDGEVRWLQARGEVVEDEEGVPVRLTGTAQDITDLHEATMQARRLAVEQAARATAETSERRMEFLARASAALASSLDYETTLATVARLAVPEMADWCAVDLVEEGGTIRRLSVEHEDPAKVQLVKELSERFPPAPDAPTGAPNVIRTGKSELVQDVPDSLLVEAAPDAEYLRILRKLGLRSYVIAPLAARGRVFGAITFVQAESGRRFDREDCLLVEDLAVRAAIAIDNARLVRELERALQTKSDFMATMSHELRTPLNAIIGYTELLEDGIPEEIPESARQHAHRIGLAAQHLLQLIDEILTFSRIQADRELVEMNPLFVKSLLSEVDAIIGPLAQEKGLDFRMTADDVPDQVLTDTRKVRQVLLNLLGNAVKFTEEGTVGLAVAREGDTLLLRVTDSGPGIPASEHRRLFEPFWQGDQSRTRKLGGAGLGLAISERLARLLGGDITVESAPGAGSTFTFRLPIQ
jgi:PAS domain S-box-containing protein